LQDVILRLKHAFDDFFRRVQNGEQPGYPRFRGKNRYDSFCYPDGAGWKLDEQKRPADKQGIVRVNLKLTKIGTVNDPSAKARGLRNLPAGPSLSSLSS
jgi:hypothetical protein